MTFTMSNLSSAISLPLPSGLALLSLTRQWMELIAVTGRAKNCWHTSSSVPILIEMKLRVVSRKVYDYIRYNLKEIAFHSSLPDPPHLKKRRKLTWHEPFLVLKKASRLYAASWVWDGQMTIRRKEVKANPMEERALHLKRKSLRYLKILRWLQEEVSRH